MNTFTSNTASIEKQIREMNSPQILEFVSTIKKDPTMYRDYNKLLAIARVQYKQLTGVPLSFQTINRL